MSGMLLMLKSCPGFKKTLCLTSRLRLVSGTCAKSHPSSPGCGAVPSFDRADPLASVSDARLATHAPSSIFTMKSEETNSVQTEENLYKSITNKSMNWLDYEVVREVRAPLRRCRGRSFEFLFPKWVTWHCWPLIRSQRCLCGMSRHPEPDMRTVDTF